MARFKITITNGSKIIDIFTASTDINDCEADWLVPLRKVGKDQAVSDINRAIKKAIRDQE